MKRTTYLNIIALFALCAGIPAQAWQWSQIDPRPYMFPAHYAALAKAEAQRKQNEQSMRNITRGAAVVAGVAAATCGTALVGAGLASGAMLISPAARTLAVEKMTELSAQMSPLKEKAVASIATLKNSAQQALYAMNEKSKLFGQHLVGTTQSVQQPLLLSAGPTLLALPAGRSVSTVASKAASETTSIAIASRAPVLKIQEITKVSEAGAKKGTGYARTEPTAHACTVCNGFFRDRTDLVRHFGTVKHQKNLQASLAV